MSRNSSLAKVPTSQRSCRLRDFWASQSNTNAVTELQKWSIATPQYLYDTIKWLFSGIRLIGSLRTYLNLKKSKHPPNRSWSSSSFTTLFRLFHRWHLLPASASGQTVDIIVHNALHFHVCYSCCGRRVLRVRLPSRAYHPIPGWRFFHRAPPHLPQEIRNQIAEHLDAQSSKHRFSAETLRPYSLGPGTGGIQPIYEKDRNIATNANTASHMLKKNAGPRRAWIQSNLVTSQ